LLMVLISKYLYSTEFKVIKHWCLHSACRERGKRCYENAYCRRLPLCV
jgi:hypothetical protein